MNFNEIHQFFAWVKIINEIDIRSRDQLVHSSDVSIVQGVQNFKEEEKIYGYAAAIRRNKKLEI